MQTNAKENGLLKQPQAKLISSLNLTSGTLLTFFIWIMDYSVQHFLDFYNSYSEKFPTVSLDLFLMLVKLAMRIVYMV